MKWKTRDGLQVEISEMDDSHLANTIAFLEKRAADINYNAWLKMDQYAADAPDGAAMAVEREMDTLAEMEDLEALAIVCPPYAAMIAERRRRERLKQRANMFNTP